MTAAEKLTKEVAERSRAEGRAEGHTEGHTKGRTEGRAELLLKQLALRFGSLPAAAEDRLRHASIDELDRFAERVLTAQSLAEVLGE